MKERVPLSSATSQLQFPPSNEIIARVRAESGVATGTGPSNSKIHAAVRAVAETFEYWYSRVMREAVDKYGKLIVARINPYVRRMQLAELTPEQAAKILVADYESRNFVTAGGWLLESLAINIGVGSKKSLIEGVDLERMDGADLHLCILKSGTVTRNSDILKVLKQNVRRAERIYKQVKTQTGAIVGDYVQMTGCTTPTHTEDAIRRPSSAQFWSELTDLDAEDALELTLAVVAESGRIVSPDASAHVEALELLVAEYIRDPQDPQKVDWEFLAERNLRERSVSWDWKEEDTARDRRAREAVAKTGYQIFRGKASKKKASKKKASKKKASKKKASKKKASKKKASNQ